MDGQLKLLMDDYLPLRDVVFNTLRQAILTGILEPGERLMEVHLAKRLGVSRTPIREAIRKLELEGLVIMIPRKGAEVAQISWKNLRDVLEMRRFLDVLCMQLACQRITEEEKIQLQEACKHFAEVTKTGDITAIAKADVEFHEILIHATRNERLLQLVHNLAEQMYRYRFEYLKDTSRHGELICEHQIMVDAIMQGKSQEGMRIAAHHIDSQEEAIITQLNLQKSEITGKGQET